MKTRFTALVSVLVQATAYGAMPDLQSYQGEYSGNGSVEEGLSCDGAKVVNGEEADVEVSGSEIVLTRKCVGEWDEVGYGIYTHGETVFSCDSQNCSVDSKYPSSVRGDFDKEHSQDKLLFLQDGNIVISTPGVGNFELHREHFGP